MFGNENKLNWTEDIEIYLNLFKMNSIYNIQIIVTFTITRKSRKSLFRLNLICILQAGLPLHYIPPRAWTSFFFPF